MKLEQSAFALGLVAGVAVGPVVGGQGVALVVIQAVAVGGDAGHEDVAANVAAKLLAERVDDGGGGAALPVVGVVEKGVEVLAGQGALHLLRVVAIGLQVLHLLAELVGRLAVQDGHLMLLLDELGDEVPSDESRAADHEDFHPLADTLLRIRDVMAVRVRYAVMAWISHSTQDRGA